MMFIPRKKVHIYILKTILLTKQNSCYLCSLFRSVVIYRLNALKQMIRNVCQISEDVTAVVLWDMQK